LRLEDLALATACAEGHADAWDHFVLEYRPHLYRVADALDPSGGARELADSLYGELYGVDERGEACQSLLRYFHGRSSLRTWLRAVLSQRYVDRIRAESRRTELPEELPDEAGSAPADLECVEYVELLGMALAAAVDRLEPRDRMRLACYYLQRLTLAETGRLLHEHEGTVSRQLARTRKMVRARAEVHLKDKGLTEAQIIRAFECASQDVGAMSLEEMFGSRKVLEPDRSL
jgi:RNA polymerase sigma factor (sigma-70 family)